MDDDDDDDEVDDDEEEIGVDDALIAFIEQTQVVGDCRSACKFCSRMQQTEWIIELLLYYRMMFRKRLYIIVN